MNEWENHITITKIYDDCSIYRDGQYQSFSFVEGYIQAASGGSVLWRLRKESRRGAELPKMVFLAEGVSRNPDEAMAALDDAHEKYRGVKQIDE